MKPEAPEVDASYVCFQGATRIAEGQASDVALAARQAGERDPEALLLIFDRSTGKVIDFDLSGTEQDTVARVSLVAAVAGAVTARRGRPKLGVVSREVTLLPRHWDWLAQQPGGASVTLRRLIETARKAEEATGDVRARTAAAYGFMSAMAGDRAGFEEASRALFAGDRPRLGNMMADWPSDIVAEILSLLER